MQLYITKITRVRYRYVVVAHLRAAAAGLKACTRSDFLLRFLRARKFDYDRAYALLINYYSIRAANVDIFKASPVIIIITSSTSFIHASTV